MNRKTFIKRILGTFLITVPGYAIIGCSETDTATEVSESSDSVDTDLANLDCLENGTKTTTINNNHGHTLTVSKGDITSGVEKTYEIKGSSEHSHTIVVSAAHFSTLIETKTVTIEATTVNDHRHYVTISCA